MDSSSKDHEIAQVDGHGWWVDLQWSKASLMPTFAQKPQPEMPACFLRRFRIKLGLPFPLATYCKK